MSFSSIQGILPLMVVFHGDESHGNFGDDHLPFPKVVNVTVSWRVSTYKSWESKGPNPNATFPQRNSRPYLKDY